jgi:hypothetical protein
VCCGHCVAVVRGALVCRGRCVAMVCGALVWAALDRCWVALGGRCDTTVETRWCVVASVSQWCAEPWRVVANVSQWCAVPRCGAVNVRWG